MRKIIIPILASLLIVGTAKAYTVQWGDTLSGIADKYNTTVESLASSNNISNPNVIYEGQNLVINRGGNLGATPSPTSSANRVYVEAQDSQLFTGAASGDTTLTLNELADIYGNDVEMLGSKMYGRINPNGDNISEAISFTGITSNSDGTVTLTGVKSVLAQYPYTETSGLTRSHSIGSLFRLTNTAAFYDDLANKENDEIIDGQWDFSTSLPTVPSTTPTNDDQVASKKYIDDTLSAGNTNLNRLTVAATAGETVSAGDIVYFDETDKEWKKAAATFVEPQNYKLGIAQGSGTDGNTISNGVLLQGYDTNQSGLSAGTLYYLSDTAGAVTSTAGTNQFELGFAYDATDFYFFPGWKSRLTYEQRQALVNANSPTGSNPLLVDSDATTTPTASKIPIAGDVLDPAWIATSTATGSIIYDNGTDFYNLGIGNAGEVLKVNSGATAPEWGGATYRLTATTTDVTTGATSDTTLLTATLPGGVLGTVNAVRIKAYISDFDLDTGDATFKLKYGSTDVATITTVAGSISNYTGWIEATLYSAGTTASQEGSISAFISSGATFQSAPVGVGTATENSTGDLSVTLEVVFSGAGSARSITMANGYIEVIQ